MYAFALNLLSVSLSIASWKAVFRRPW